MELLNEEVVVHNSYDIKEQLRGLGFHWDGDRRVWARSMVEVKQALGLEDQADITLAKILALPPQTQTHPQDGNGMQDNGDQDAHGSRSGLRSPSPLPVDETPGENLLSDMGRSLQGWTQPEVSAQSAN